MPGTIRRTERALRDVARLDAVVARRVVTKARVCEAKTTLVERLYPHFASTSGGVERPRNLEGRTPEVDVRLVALS